MKNMKNPNNNIQKNFLQKLLAVVLSVSLLIGGSSVAFALDGAAKTDLITITVSDGTNTKTDIGGDSLSDAITKSTLTATTITKLTVTAGAVTDADWIWFKGGSVENIPAVLSALTDFTVSGTFTSVADIPTDGDFSVFPTSIVKVTIPQVSKIGVSAFQSCKKLTTVSFPKVTEIDASAFQSCERLTATNFPKVITIGKAAFKSCYSTKDVGLASANFPEATTIGEDAFRSCKRLKTISFPKVETIGENAFNGCGDSVSSAETGLKTISFPAVTTIGANAFETCTMLNTASFPKVTTIEAYAFYGCGKLAKLKLGATPPTVAKANAFVSRTKTLKLVGDYDLDLTGTVLTKAIADYDKVTDATSGNADKDGEWYGWTLPTPPVLVTGVTLDKTKLSLEEGNNENLVAAITPDNATDKTVTWSSDTPAVATVANGTVTAVAVGDATITVTTTDGGKTATCAVTVTKAVIPPPPVAVTGVTLNKTTLSLEVSKSETLTATVIPDNADDKSVRWESSSDAIATVANGTVTAIKEGTAIITVKTNDNNKTAACDVTVTKATAPPDPPTAPTLPPITGGSNNSGSTSTATATSVTPTTKTDGKTTEVAYNDVTTSTEVIGDITATTAEITLDDTTAAAATATNPIEIIVALSATDAAATISAATTKAVAFAFTVSDSISTNPYVYMKELKAGSDIIKAAATAEKDISFAVKSADGKLLFSMKFKGSELSAGGKSLADLNLAMNMVKPSAKIAKALQKSTVLSFQNNGVFPSPCTVTANVADVFSDGTVLNLYYDNAKNGTLELVENGLTVSFGEVQATINHASDYILSETYLDPKNASTNPATGIASTGVALLSKLF